MSKDQTFPLGTSTARSLGPPAGSVRWTQTCLTRVVTGWLGDWVTGWCSPGYPGFLQGWDIMHLRHRRPTPLSGVNWSGSESRSLWVLRGAGFQNFQMQRVLNLSQLPRHFLTSFERPKLLVAKEVTLSPKACLSPPFRPPVIFLMGNTGEKVLPVLLAAWNCTSKLLGVYRHHWCAEVVAARTACRASQPGLTKHWLYAPEGVVWRK